MAYNKSNSGIPANATESINIPSSGGRSKSVDFTKNRQSYGSDPGGGMGAPADMSLPPVSGRGNNPIQAPKVRGGGFKKDGPDSVSFGKS